MSGIIRQHRLQEGNALDRRRLEELFFEARQRFAQITHWSIGDDVLTRQSFDDHAWEEYRFTAVLNGNYRIPTHGHLISGCFLQVNHAEEYYEGQLHWSINVHPLTAACKRIVAWPVCNGNLLVGGHDSVECEQAIKYDSQDPADPAIDPSTATELAASSIDNTYDFCLGGTASFSGVAAASTLGVLVMGVGHFQVDKACIGHRKVLR